MNRQSVAGIAALVFIAVVVIAIFADLFFGVLGLFGA